MKGFIEVTVIFHKTRFYRSVGPWEEETYKSKEKRLVHYTQIYFDVINNKAYFDGDELVETYSTLKELIK